jgi:hypothetical protein
VRVKLSVGSQAAEVTVYGTPRACAPNPQIGLPLSQRADRRDADPRPQVHDAAAPQLGVPAGQGHGRPLRQRDLLHHRRGLAPRDDLHARRREQRRGLGPPDGHRHRAARSHSGDHNPLERVLLRVRLDIRPRAQHRHQVRHERLPRRRHVPGSSRWLAGEDLLDRRLLPVRPCRVASRPRRFRPSTPWTSPTRCSRSPARSAGPDRQDKTFFFATADYTRQNRTTFLSSALPAFVLPADGNLDYTGHYRQFLFDGAARPQAHVEPER